MELPKRKPIRLKDFDYAQSGAYFVTICSLNRECILGEIIVGQGLCSCPTVGDVICSFKSITTKKSNLFDDVKGRGIWQFRYHDHIIRDEQECQKILEYIETNPQKWEEDRYYPL